MTPNFDGGARHVQIRNSQGADAGCASGSAVGISTTNIDTTNSNSAGHRRQSDGQLLGASAADISGHYVNFQRCGIGDSETGEADVGQVQANTTHITVGVFNVTNGTREVTGNADAVLAGY